MIIVGVDYHPSVQQVAFLDTETGETGERRLNHSDGEAERFYRDLQRRQVKVRVGIEATGHARWFERLLAELKFELWIGDPARIEVVTKLTAGGRRRKTGNLPERILCSSIRGFGALFRQAWSAFVKLAAPSTFVMRLRLYAIVAIPISPRAPFNPRINRRGCPKMRYFIVAKGCSTVHWRSLIASGVTRFCILFRASSYKWRASPRLGACVQREFREQAPQSADDALYIV